MKITALALNGMRGWPDLEISPIFPGLNVIQGPASSGKTTLSEFLAHVVFGRVPAASEAPAGEATLEAGGRCYQLRRYHDGTAAGRLTVASLSGEVVDRETVKRLLGGLSASLLARVYATNFAAGRQVDSTDAAEFASEFRNLIGQGEPGRKASDLAAKRDALAAELESRVAAERRVSGELEHRRRETERRIREGEKATSAIELRLRAVESALAETDARLRYRRLELNTELRWHTLDANEWEPHLAELDQEIARWRATAADLARREANVRAKLVPATASETPAVSITEQRAWMAVARQLAADLDGEVARLARATASQQCVCQDAHPRLRPMVETLARQLNRLEALIEARQRADEAADWADEAEHLARTQAELRRQLDHLVDRRQALANEGATSRRRAAQQLGDAQGIFSAADAEQLEQRRLELEQERFTLSEKLRLEQNCVGKLREERTTIDRQRARLLSARSIEQIQRELADAQQDLEQTAGEHLLAYDSDFWSNEPWRASDFLAQLTDGQLVRVELGADGRRAWAVRNTCDAVALESLSPAEASQVYLSFVFALVAAVARRGVYLPLVLDDHFERLDERGTAALAAVLAEFGRQENQVLAFTGQKTAVQRLAALGATVHDLVARRHWKHADPLPAAPASPKQSAGSTIPSTPVPRRCKKLNPYRALRHRAGREAANRHLREVPTNDIDAA